MKSASLTMILLCNWYRAVEIKPTRIFKKEEAADLFSMCGRVSIMKLSAYVDEPNYLENFRNKPNYFIFISLYIIVHVEF